MHLLFPKKALDLGFFIGKPSCAAATRQIRHQDQSSIHVFLQCAKAACHPNQVATVSLCSSIWAIEVHKDQKSDLVDLAANIGSL